MKNSKFSHRKSSPVPVFSQRQVKDAQDAMIPVSDLMMPFSINNLFHHSNLPKSSPLARYSNPAIKYV